MRTFLLRLPPHVDDKKIVHECVERVESQKPTAPTWPATASCWIESSSSSIPAQEKLEEAKLPMSNG